MLEQTVLEDEAMLLFDGRSTRMEEMLLLGEERLLKG